MRGDNRDGKEAEAEGLLARIGRRLAAERGRLMSFGAVGVVNGVVNYLVTVGLIAGLFTPLGLGENDIALGVAKAAGWAVAVTNSYILNAKTTFAAESGGRLSFGTYGRFVASGLVGLVAEVTSFLVAVRFLPLLAASIVPIGVAFLVNFTMARLLVFPQAGTRK